MKRDKSWDCESEEHLFRALIGDPFGDNPEQQIDLIRRDKKRTADIFRGLLGFGPTDRVVDLGSGTGFVSWHLAALVERIYCLDISLQFHQFCARQLQSFENVDCHLIGYADFSPLEGCGVNKVFASGLFIHFNIFDLVNYLKAVHRLLPIGGIFAFDFADGEILNVDRLDTFIKANESYLEDRGRVLGLINWNGLSVVRGLAAQIGSMSPRCIIRTRPIATLPR
jgi:SAM-dependent methyltransferase